MLLSLLPVTAANAQLGNILNHAKNKVNDKANEKVDKTIDDATKKQDTNYSKDYLTMLDLMR